jgi:protocatechuate 3,4-dioxygenase beta subunit
MMLSRHIIKIGFVSQIGAIVFFHAVMSAQEPSGSVRGQVTSNSGDPIRKAEVTLRSADRRPGPGNVIVATSDGAGTFTFSNVQPGKYVISARRNGFVSQIKPRTAGSPPSVQAITVSPGEELTGLSIKLTPHSIVTGKVLDEDGEPMFGAAVNMMEERYFRGRRTLNGRGSGTVNDLGEYRIAGLQPGRYFIAVQPRGDYGPAPLHVRPPGEEVDRNYVTVYYPGVFEQSQATPLDLEPGQEARGIDIQVRKAATVHVRGRVLDDAGNPLSGIAVTVVSGENPVAGFVGRNMGVVRDDGAFDVSGIPPGTHTLIANRMSREHGRASATLRVEVGLHDLDGVILRMSPPAQISGIIRAAENPNLDAVRVTLDPMDNSSFDMQSSRTLGAGNTFTVPGIPPGNYRVDVFGAPDGYYVKSVQVGGQDYLESGLAISGSIMGVDVVLSKGAATVEGAVVDSEGKAIGQSVIALVPPPAKREQWRLFKTSLSDQSGRFIFRNLPPGEYTLWAFGTDGDASAVQNPEYLKQIESRGTVIKLGENARESVQLKVVE